jgi:hypothetical protein
MDLNDNHCHMPGQQGLSAHFQDCAVEETLNQRIHTKSSLKKPNVLVRMLVKNDSFLWKHVELIC